MGLRKPKSTGKLVIETNMAKATHPRHQRSISSIKTVMGFLAATFILQSINLLYMISRSPLPTPLIGSMNMTSLCTGRSENLTATSRCPTSIKPQNLQIPPPIQHRGIPFAYFYLLAGETHRQFESELVYHPLRSHLTIQIKRVRSW